MTRAPRLVEDAAPLTDALGDLWLAVTRAGGAVGFLPDGPAAEVRARTIEVIDDVRGWTEVGVFRNALRLGPGPEDLRDEHWFQVVLR